MINYGLDEDQENAIKTAINALEKRINESKWDIESLNRDIPLAERMGAFSATIIRMHYRLKELEKQIAEDTSALEHLRSLVTVK